MRKFFVLLCSYKKTIFCKGGTDDEKNWQITVVSVGRVRVAVCRFAHCGDGYKRICKFST